MLKWPWVKPKDTTEFINLKSFTFNHEIKKSITPKSSSFNHENCETTKKHEKSCISVVSPIIGSGVCVFVCIYRVVLLLCHCLFCFLLSGLVTFRDSLLSIRLQMSHLGRCDKPVAIYHAHIFQVPFIFHSGDFLMNLVHLRLSSTKWKS